MSMSFGDRLKEARKLKNMTQQELAEMLDISINSIANYERGVSFPKEDYLYKIINICGLDPNYMFQDDIDINTGFWFEESNLLKNYRSLDTRSRIYVNSMVKYEAERAITINLSSEGKASYICFDVTQGTLGKLVNTTSEDIIILPEKPKDADYVVKIKGDGMKPALFDGDILIMKYAVDLKNGSWGLFNFDGYTVLCKKVHDKYISFDGKIFSEMRLMRSMQLYGRVAEIHKICKKNDKPVPL